MAKFSPDWHCPSCGPGFRGQSPRRKCFACQATLERLNAQPIGQPVSPADQARLEYPRYLGAQQHFVRGYNAALGCADAKAALVGSDAEKAGERAGKRAKQSAFYEQHGAHRCACSECLAGDRRRPMDGYQLKLVETVEAREPSEVEALGRLYELAGKSLANDNPRPQPSLEGLALFDAMRSPALI